MKNPEGRQNSPSSILAPEIKSWKAERQLMLARIKSLKSRGAINREIIQLFPKFNETSVSKISNKEALKWTANNLCMIYFDGEYVADRARRIKKELDDPKSLSDDRKESIEFARKLLEGNLIGNNSASWTRLHDIFERNKRLLPEDFSDKIILEVYVDAVYVGNRKKYETSETYNRIKTLAVKQGSLFAEKLAEHETLIKENISYRKNNPGRDWDEDWERHGFKDYNNINNKKSRQFPIGKGGTTEENPESMNPEDITKQKIKEAIQRQMDEGKKAEKKKRNSYKG